MALVKKNLGDEGGRCNRRRKQEEAGEKYLVRHFPDRKKKILLDHIQSGRARPFLDDIAVKGPKSNYDNKEVEPENENQAIHIISVRKII